MTIDERSVGGVKILDVSGQITVGSGDLLKDKIHSMVHQGNTKVVVNLAGVDYMDSTGLGQLVGAYTTVARAGGKLKLVNVTKRLSDLLSITKLLTVFDTFDSEADAVKSYA